MADVTKIKIGNNFYRATDLYGKTLYVTRDKTRFKGSFDNAPSVGTTKAGEPAGKFLGVLFPNAQVNRSKTYLLFGNSPSDVREGKAYNMLYDSAHFSESALKKQGVKTEAEILKEEEQGEKKWYEKLKIGPYALAAVAIYALVSRAKFNFGDKKESA